jgi:hypothetical protein
MTKKEFLGNWYQKTSGNTFPNLGGTGANNFRKTR